MGHEGKRWNYTFRVPCEVVFTVVAEERHVAYSWAQEVFYDLAESGLCPRLETRDGELEDVQVITYPIPYNSDAVPPTPEQEMFRYLVSVVEKRDDA